MTDRVVWSDQAQADLADFIDHYAPNDLPFAVSVSTQAVAATRFLAMYPHAGQQIRSSALRKWPIAKTPLLLIYSVAGKSIQVARLVHNRSDWIALG